MKINIDPKKIEEVLNRGVEKVIEREHLEKRMEKGDKLRVKFGIDPTAPDLHLGHSVTFLKLRQFQEMGHHIIFLIGDFTAKIGDPSGRSETRKMLTTKEAKRNMKSYVRQAAKILDVRKIEIRHNSEWYDKKDAAFFMDLSSRFTVARMMERGDFKERLKKNIDISFLEIVYPLLQGYDSVELKADIEIGGSDQEFNLLVGRRVQKRYGLPQQDIITMQLLEGTDGMHKMSKTYNNTINLNDSPNEMFGKIMSIPDSLLGKYFKLLTNIPLGEIQKIEEDINHGFLNPGDVKRRLSKEIISFYYNPEIAQKAEIEFNKVFKKKEAPSQMPEYKIKEQNLPILDLLMKTNLAPSKSEAKRLVEQGAIKIDGQLVEDWKAIIKIKDGTIVQAGHRKFVRIDIAK